MGCFGGIAVVVLFGARLAGMVRKNLSIGVLDDGIIILNIANKN